MKRILVTDQIMNKWSNSMYNAEIYAMNYTQLDVILLYFILEGLDRTKKCAFIVDIFNFSSVGVSTG